jgi:hypothetical protein
VSDSKKKKRLVALMSGHDWTDAGVDHLIVPKEMDLNQEKADYEKEHSRSFDKPPKLPYISFTQWLINHGCTKALNIEEFWQE